MAFPIVPRRRSGSAGNPTSLNLGELAVNTHDGSVYLGADVGVVQIGIPVAAGTEETVWTANGSASQFAPINGYNGIDVGGYLVTVQGIQQPFTVSADNGGTLVFDFTPPTGSVIRARAITQAMGGGGGSSDATSIQGVAVNATAPNDGQALVYNATSGEWEPTYLHGTQTWTDTQTFSWTAPLGFQGYIRLQMQAGNGQPGDFNLNDGQDGKQCVFGTKTAARGYGGGGGNPDMTGSSQPGNAGRGPQGGGAGSESGQGVGGWSGGNASASNGNDLTVAGAGQPPYGGGGGNGESNGANWYGYAGGGGGGTSGGGGASSFYFFDGSNYQYAKGDGGAGGLGEIVDMMYWVTGGETISGEITDGFIDLNQPTPFITVSW
jgi:hypothetical protein